MDLVIPTLLAAVSDLPEAASDILLKNGVMGAVFVLVVIPLAWFGYKMTKLVDSNQKASKAELKSIQDARTADAQAVADKLIHLSEQWNTTVSKQIVVFDTFNQALKDQQEVLKEMRDLLLESHSRRK